MQTPELAPLLKVCALLNEEESHYLIVGGQAVILHGLVRTTEDVDLLIEPSDDNCRRVPAAPSKLQDGAAKELTPRDLLENGVVKIAGEVGVDVSTHAWKVSYQDAVADSIVRILEGVRGVRLEVVDSRASREVVGLLALRGVAPRSAAQRTRARPTFNHTRVRVPYLGWEALITSKQTCRERDPLDLLQLMALKERL